MYSQGSGDKEIGDRALSSDESMVALLMGRVRAAIFCCWGKRGDGINGVGGGGIMVMGLNK